eukprot:SAG31_NODE_2491_length_5612_cov_23.752766_3_plen_696_part_00
MILCALMCGCADGKAGQNLAAVFNRLDTLERELQQERTDKAVLQAKFVDARKRNEAQEKLLLREVAELKNTLHACGELTNETRADMDRMMTHVNKTEHTMNVRLDQCEEGSDQFVQIMKRRRIQEDVFCRESGLAAMLQECCPSAASVEAGHHRFLQSDHSSLGCDAVPDTCAEDCSPLFVEYYERCQEMIDMLAPEERQNFESLYADCEEVEQARAALLQDARPAMIFHVAVIDQEAEQQEALLNDGGSAPGKDFQPIDLPLPAPSPSPPSLSPSQAGGLQTAQQFQRVCTTINLTVCVPKCGRSTSGFLLSIEIDNRGTVMTCNKIGNLFSWQGQASLGGYIGTDIAAFFSSVLSGAAGTYMVSLQEDAGMETDLTIQLGQSVLVSGDVSLATLPAWGAGTFTVQQGGSLTLTSVQLVASLTVVDGGSAVLDSCSVSGAVSVSLPQPLSLQLSNARAQSQHYCVIPHSDRVAAANLVAYLKHSQLSCCYDVSMQISAITVTSGSTLSLSRMALPVAAYSKTLLGVSDAGSRLVFDGVTVVEQPELGVLTGSMTIGADGSTVMDPPSLMLELAQTLFVVRSGPCTVAQGGQCVGRWPGGYLPNEHCEIAVSGPDGATGTLGDCPVFDINQRTLPGDVLTMPDRSHASRCPVGAVLSAGRTLTWASDYRMQGSNGDGLPQSQNDGAGGGWQICFE